MLVKKKGKNYALSIRKPFYCHVIKTVINNFKMYLAIGDVNISIGKRGCTVTN